MQINTYSLPTHVPSDIVAGNTESPCALSAIADLSRSGSGTMERCT